MLENLYTFKKTSWHVKLFTWIYGESPVKIYKSMCPYFWTYVLTLIFLPFILIFKLFNKSSKKILNNLRTYKERKREEIIKKFIIEASTLNSDEEYYEFKSRKCYTKYGYRLDGDLYYKIKYGAREFEYNLNSKKEKDKEKKLAKIETYKESKYFTVISFVISIIVFGLIGYLLYSLIGMIHFSPIDWDKVFMTLYTIGIIVGIGVIIYILFRFVLVPLIDKLKCIKLPKCRVCELGKHLLLPFKMLWTLLLIISNMIYVTYKKNCPMITWEDEKKRK